MRTSKEAEPTIRERCAAFGRSALRLIVAGISARAQIVAGAGLHGQDR